MLNFVTKQGASTAQTLGVIGELAAGRSKPFCVTGMEGLDWHTIINVRAEQLWHINHIYKQFFTYFSLYYHYIYILFRV